MQTKNRAIRLAIQEVLLKYNIDDVSLELELDSAVQSALQDNGNRLLEKERNRDKDRILKAIIKGTVRDADLKSLWFSAFHTNPNWDNKQNKIFLAFLRARPPDQTLDDFASWWWQYDWRGKQSEPPSPALVMENWEMAFQKTKKLLFDV